MDPEATGKTPGIREISFPKPDTLQASAGCYGKPQREQFSSGAKASSGFAEQPSCEEEAGDEAEQHRGGARRAAAEAAEKTPKPLLQQELSQAWRSQ